MTAHEKRIDRFLFGEMSETELKEFEDLLIVDDEVFFEIVQREDDLIDQFVRDGLPSDERDAVLTSLSRVPGRRDRVANAAALAKLVREETSSISYEKPVAAGRLELLLSSIGFSSLKLGLAATGLIVLFAGSTVFLVLRDLQREVEIAAMQGDRPGQLDELKNQLSESRLRENELQGQIDAEREVAGDLTVDLEAERKRRADLENEIAAIRRQRPDLPKPSPRKTERPNVGAITLTPGGDDRIASYEPLQSVKRISVVIQLPVDIDPTDRLSVRLNGREIVSGVAIRTDAAGKKSLPVTVASDQLQPGRNLITAHNNNGDKVSEYTLAADKEEE